MLRYSGKMGILPGAGVGFFIELLAIFAVPTTTWMIIVKSLSCPIK